METAHLLSLKVMRVSKPTLTTSSQPFFSTSPSLSAHASASLLSLQGARPLPGHPKTLRDFALTELLTLPSTFGAISLGETFSSAFCVNNECDVPVSGAHLKMEVQTATAKFPLAEFGGLETTLQPNEPLEGVVHHEIKELNQHVLACTVSYLLPDSMMNSHATGPPEDPSNPKLRIFRKYYKFTVTNPLSVKTKVHLPKSSSALMSAIEREKVFLEVHVQNLTSDPLSFDRMKFDCVDGWDAEDANMLPGETPESVFSGTTITMQPQDTRQYLFILTPKPDAIPSFPVIHQPGSVIPLGRLDISWRTGRLLTSVLSRRIPLLPAPPPAPAIPPHLQQSPRPQSPGPNAHRPQSPAFRVRNHQPAAPSQSTIASAPANPQHITRPDIEVDLIITKLDRDGIRVEDAFKVEFKLTLSALLPSTSWPRPGVITPAQASITRDRILHLIVQHIIPPRPAAISQSLANAQNATISVQSDRERTILASRQSTVTTSSAPYAIRRSLSSISLTRRSDSTAWGASEVASLPDSGASTTLALSPTLMSADERPDSRSRVHLPSPFKDVAVVAGSKLRQGPGGGDPPGSSEDQAIIFLGSSTLRLPPFRIISPPHGKTPDPASPPNSQKEDDQSRGQSSTTITLEYMPLQQGFTNIGGLKVLVVEDLEVPSGADESEAHREPLPYEPKVIKEWESVGEIWVKPAAT